MDFFTALFTQPVPRHRANPCRAGLEPYYVPHVGWRYIEVIHPAPFGKRERRLAAYWRYRNSDKGVMRTRRYNASEAHAACCRKYRDQHPRTEELYQNSQGHWVHPVKIDLKQ